MQSDINHVRDHVTCPYDQRNWLWARNNVRDVDPIPLINDAKYFSSRAPSDACSSSKTLNRYKFAIVFKKCNGFWSDLGVNSTNMYLTRPATKSFEQCWITSVASILNTSMTVNGTGVPSVSLGAMVSRRVVHLYSFCFWITLIWNWLPRCWFKVWVVCINCTRFESDSIAMTVLPSDEAWNAKYPKPAMVSMTTCCLPFVATGSRSLSNGQLFINVMVVVRANFDHLSSCGSNVHMGKEGLVYV